MVLPRHFVEMSGAGVKPVHRAKAHGGRRIHVHVEVMHEMEPPEKWHLVREHVPHVNGVIQRQKCGGITRPFGRESCRAGPQRRSAMRSANGSTSGR